MYSVSATRNAQGWGRALSTSLQGAGNGGVRNLAWDKRGHFCSLNLQLCLLPAFHRSGSIPGGLQSRVPFSYRPQTRFFTLVCG